MPNSGCAVLSGVDAENGADSVDDSDSLGNGGGKKNNLTPTSATPTPSGTAAKEKRNRPFFKKVYRASNCLLNCVMKFERKLVAAPSSFIYNRSEVHNVLGSTVSLLVLEG